MANRFWKAQPVSGAIVSVASPPQIRLTVASTTGMTTGDVRTVFGIVGTTEANGTWTITVIDATHIDLQGTTFANLYTSGGAVNGRWDTTNTNNWVTTSNGVDYGQTVPGSSDDVTLDGSSGGGTVTVNTDFSVLSLTCGAFTGTLDFSANNNSPTLGGNFSISGTGTRTINLGSGTFTMTVVGTFWNATTTTNLTFNAGGSTIKSGNVSSTVVKTFAGGGLTYNNVILGSNTSTGSTNITGNNTFAAITLTSPLNFTMTAAATQTVNSLTVSGNLGVIVASVTVGAATNVSRASGTNDLAGALIRNVAFAGGATFTATGYNFGGNSGITITPPTAPPSSIDVSCISATIVDSRQMIGY